MLGRYLVVSNKFLHEITPHFRNFGFLASSSANRVDELKSLEQMKEKLAQKSLDSKVFLNKASKVFLDLSSESSAKTQISDKQTQKKLNDCCLVISDSLKYISTAMILDGFKMIEKELFSKRYDKNTLETLLESLTLLVSKKRINSEQVEYCLERIYYLFEGAKKDLSTDLYIDLMKSSNYHETFEQERLGKIQEALFNFKLKKEFYNQHIVNFDILSNFLTTVTQMKHSSDWTVKIYESFFPVFADVKIQKLLNGNSSEENQENPEQEKQENKEKNKKLNESIKIVTSNESGFPSKIQKFLSTYPDSELKEDMQADFILEIETYFDTTSAISSHDLYQIIELIPIAKRIAPIPINQKLLHKVVEYLMNNMNLMKSMEFSHLIYLMIYANFNLKIFASKNLVIVALAKQVASKINNELQLLFVLPVLLGYNIISQEIIELIGKIPVENKKKFSNIELIYYITTYIRLFSKSSSYNKITLNEFRKIDDLLEKFHSKFTLTERCALIFQTRTMSSHNRNVYLIKPVMEVLDQVPPYYFAGIVNNLINSSYFLINKHSLVSEVAKRIPILDHKELVLIGKAFMWQDMGDMTFWTQFFDRLASVYKEYMMKNTLWICDLHQIMYSLKMRDSVFYEEILTKIKVIDFKEIERIYTERPNMPTTDEVTKSEFEIEQLIQKLEIKYERQAIIGIHRVDFVIHPNTIVELNGRHHFTERNILNAASLWRERQLIQLGYRVIGITLQDWNDLMTFEKKEKFLREKLNL